MKSVVRFGVVGVGGYAQSYHNSLAILNEAGLSRLIAVAENNQAGYRKELEILRARGIRIYDDYNKMLQSEKNNLDFVALPVGIHLHAAMTIEALRAGLNVICEKPIAAAVQEVDRMIAAKNETGAIVIVGYQEIYSPSIRMLKERIMDGRLGKVLLARTKGRWSRPDSYYQRNNWAGKLRLGESWILDGIAMNAMAHFINNMLFLTSQKPETTAIPIEVRAELYRAHPIESYDTITLRAKVNTGSSIYFAATHAPETEQHPELQLQCEFGAATRHFLNGETIIHYKDGTGERFDNGNNADRTDVFRNAIACLRNSETVLSTLEMARSHTLCMNGTHESCPDIVSIPADQIIRTDIPDAEGNSTGDIQTKIRGIDAILDHAFDEAKLLSEIGANWARSSKTFSLVDYDKFPASG